MNFLLSPVQTFIHSICFQNICFLIGFTSYWFFVGAIKPHKVPIDKGLVFTEVKVVILNFFFLIMDWDIFFSHVTLNLTNYRSE